MGTSEQTELAISVRFDGVNHTVVLEGELDLATAPRVESALKALVPDVSGLVLLDLQRLSFSDATGLRAIERAAQALGGRLIVCGPQPPVRGIIELTRLDERIAVKERGASDVSDIPGGNVAYVRQLWEAYDKGGAERIVDMADDDVSWTPLGAKGSLRTRELPAFWSSRPVLRMIPVTMNAVGHDVLVTWRLEGGDLTEMWTLYRFDERRLVEAVSFDSEAEAIAALRLFERGEPDGSGA